MLCFRWATLPIVPLLALVAAVVSGLAPLTASAARTGDARTSARVVATVESVTGTNLWVLHASGNTVLPLRAGDKVQLGDIVAAGPGVEAKFTLAPPSGIPQTTELFNVYKQLASGSPTAAEIGKEFGILQGAATVLVRRSGTYVDLTFTP